MNLTNQTILITGATSGIGLQLAIKLHKLNNKIIICGRNKKRLDEISNKNPDIDTFLCDVSKEADRVELADWAIGKYPNLNVIINNAGIMQLFDLTNSSDVGKITEEVTTNLIAPVHLIGLFVAHLQKQDDAAIVNISSGLGFTPLASVPVYCATKAGIHSYSTSLRYQLRDTRVKVFEIIPPAVQTDLGKVNGYDQDKDSAMKLEDFIEEVIKALKEDKYQKGIGIAESLVAQRDELFGMINP